MPVSGSFTLIMANVLAIHSVGNSLVSYLSRAYPPELRAQHSCDFQLFSSGQIANLQEDLSTTLSLYLYRVTVNDQMRNIRRTSDAPGRDVPLSLDLHYLMSVWTDSAVAEHHILAWAMRELYLHPTLNTSSLSAEAGWTPNDIIQIIPSELSTEDMMRIWDALEPSYRLSVAYIARVVRIDPDHVPEALPVVATRFHYNDYKEQP